MMLAASRRRVNRNVAAYFATSPTRSSSVSWRNSRATATRNASRMPPSTFTSRTAEDVSVEPTPARLRAWAAACSARDPTDGAAAAVDGAAAAVDGVWGALDTSSFEAPSLLLLDAAAPAPALFWGVAFDGVATAAGFAAGDFAVDAWTTQEKAKAA
jgi:predicted lipid-binding transport protein (Tim44 family)